MQFQGDYNDKNKKQRRYRVLKRIGKLFLSRSFYGSIIFATALWTYASLTQQYVTTIKVPLQVKLPANKSVENSLPEFILMKVKGSGWHLFNLLFIKSATACVVDLTTISNKSNIYNVKEEVLLQSLESQINVLAEDALPESLEIVTGGMKEAKVDIKANVKINPREEFSLVGDVAVSPEYVNIVGNEKWVSNLKYWKTEFQEFNDVNTSFSKQINLETPSSTNTRLSRKNVVISANIQQTAEITLEDVKLDIEGGQLDNLHSIRPNIFTITLRGGVNEIENLKSEKISISLSSRKILEDTTGILVPDVLNIPKNLELVKIDPQFVYHSKKVLTFR